MNPKISWKATSFILTALLVGSLIVSTSITMNIIEERNRAADWKNTTEWATNQTLASVYFQISSQIVAQGYISWCVGVQNRTHCGYLVAQNFTEARP